MCRSVRRARLAAAAVRAWARCSRAGGRGRTQAGGGQRRDGAMRLAQAGQRVCVVHRRCSRRGSAVREARNARERRPQRGSAGWRPCRLRWCLGVAGVRRPCGRVVDCCGLCAHLREESWRRGGEWLAVTGPDLGYVGPAARSRCRRRRDGGGNSGGAGGCLVGSSLEACPRPAPWSRGAVQPVGARGGSGRPVPA